MTCFRSLLLASMLGLCVAALVAPSEALAGEPAKAPKSPTIKLARFAVDGMVTDNCPVLVKTALKGAKGVKRVDANLNTKSAEVEFVDGETTPEALAAILKKDVGFEVRVVEVTAVTTAPKK